MNNLNRKVWNAPLVELLARFIVGLTFIYASYHKILAPAEFAKAIYGYDLFPAEAINLIAIVIPFIELISGIALITGFYTQSAVLIIDAMLIFFIIIISINLIRGHQFDCGCFSVESDWAADRPAFLLGRNVVLLIMGIYIYFYGLWKSRIYVLSK